MRGLQTHLSRGIVLGLASGILSTSGTATVLLSTPPDALPRWARSRWVRRLAVAGAIGEVIANATISSLPRRTEPEALSGRVLMGALAGGLATRGSNSSGLAGAVAGGAAAPVSAWMATNGRAAIVPRVPDLVVAGFETVLAFGLSRMATRR